VGPDNGRGVCWFVRFALPSRRGWFDNSACKYVGEGPAHGGVLPGTPVGQGRVPHGHRLSPVRASGQIVRGREEAGPDPQELLRETNFDDGSSDDKSVSSYSDRLVPGSGMPGSFCLVVGPFGPLAPMVSVEGGPRAAAVFATVFLLILESSSSADFGRRSKHPAGFRMAVSAYCNMRLGGLAGGSCLSLLWRVAGSVRVQLLCPIFIRSRGSIR
jgi:hypothetical protein